LIPLGELLFSNQLGDLGISNSPLSCSYFLIINPLFIIPISFPYKNPKIYTNPRKVHNNWYQSHSFSPIASAFSFLTTKFIFFLFPIQHPKTFPKYTMAALWHQQAPLVRKALEFLGQMRETMTLTVEHTPIGV
jgi:hypothetical protein